ncbi:hypothetical protein O181_121291 [Austropuccinia psidii MF-1]|uniref:Uncharacterized protein n=1 Tax=Austropuccinia psidii MF-1 TaxID=1389203 RepID=A0A9Q3KK51_9BASI|nr:hypothetical protein [Austropuccinia psidii MF-1]
MPIQHSPPARQTRSQARTQAVLTPTPRAPLDGTQQFLNRGPNWTEDPLWKEQHCPGRKEEGPEDQVHFQE